MFNWLDILILAVVEGLTEFLPVSSTGHMIIAADVLKIAPSEALTSLLVIIQVGAILAVISIYRQILLDWARAWLRLLRPGRNAQTKFGMNREQAARHRRYSALIAAAVIPFGVVGYLNRDLILRLFTPTTVAVALIAGGVLMLLESVISRHRAPPSDRPREVFGVKDALIIGFGQCLALWPGFSRAAATILAARVAGFSRPAAAELSFLIGLPTILGTGAYEMKHASWTPELLPYIIVGSLIAWLTAYLSVKWLVAWLHKYSLNIFGWYRIGLGGLILILAFS